MPLLSPRESGTIDGYNHYRHNTNMSNVFIAMIIWLLGLG